MDTLAIIIDLLSKQNKTQKELTDYLGVSKNAFTNWKNGSNTSYMKKLPEISKFFSVSIDYLLGDQVTSKEIEHARKKARDLLEAVDIELSTIEETFETNYATFRAWLSGYSDFFNSVPRLKKLAELFDISLDELLGITPSYPGQTIPYNSKNVIKIPVYGFVAAGEGMFAESNILDYETAEISDTTPDRKYFYLKIHGDSMYPIFIEGDYILVQQQTSVDSGDFAVALVDDCEGVVKRVVYGDDWIQLQSVNPMYPPRRFDGPDVQRIKIIGLVKSLKRKF